MSIVKQFERIGARAAVYDSPRANPIIVDIRRDKYGEYFDIAVNPSAEVQVVDCRPEIKHLLLMAKDGSLKPAKDKFLCGHDERHWFVAACPGAPATVPVAMETLKPAAVREMEQSVGVRKKDKNKRSNKAWKRQGEWFFTPAYITPQKDLILTNEPLRRGRGKSHWMEFAYRKGGETVYVHPTYAPNGITEPSYRALQKKARLGTEKVPNWGWQVMSRNPEVYAKGKISHSDHATIILNSWHRVFMNTENNSRAMKNVAFLD